MPLSTRTSEILPTCNETVLYYSASDREKLFNAVVEALQQETRPVSVYQSWDSFNYLLVTPLMGVSSESGALAAPHHLFLTTLVVCTSAHSIEITVRIFDWSCCVAWRVHLDRWNPLHLWIQPWTFSYQWSVYKYAASLTQFFLICEVLKPDYHPFQYYDCALEELAAKTWIDSKAEKEKIRKYNVQEYKHKA